MTCFVKLSRLFRGLFLHALEKAFTAGRLRFFSGLLPLQERAAFLRHLAPARKSEWVVFAKRPFAGPEQALTYVGRYTHRIAIANSRLFSIDDGRVRFRWKDYRRGNPHSAMTLTAGAENGDDQVGCRHEGRDEGDGPVSPLDRSQVPMHIRKMRSDDFIGGLHRRLHSIPDRIERGQEEQDEDCARRRAADQRVGKRPPEIRSY